MSTRTFTAFRVALTLAGGLTMCACTGNSPTSPATTSTAATSIAATSTPPTATPSTSNAVASTSATSAGTPTATPVGPSSQLIEAPSAPTAPAASTAGSLSLASLPVPAGWKAVAGEGGREDGYLGNGTPARARSAPHAAYEIMSVGCAEVDRSTWTDPIEALEVSLARGSSTGVAEVMTFKAPEQAGTWFAAFQEQLRACTTATSPKVTPGTTTATTWAGRRSYGAGDDWAEVGAVTGTVVRLYLLQDPGQQFGQPAQQKLLGQLAE